jgi:hypothetical protein
VQEEESEDKRRNKYRTSDVEAKAGRLCDDLAAAYFDRSLSTCTPLPSIKTSHRIAMIYVADGPLSWQGLLITIPRSEARDPTQLSVRRLPLW